MPVQMNEHIGRQLIELDFPRRVVIQMLSKAPVAEIAKQQKPALQVPGKDLGRRESDRGEPLRHRDEWPNILVVRRSVHEDCGALPQDDPEVAAKRRVPRERQDIGSLPSAGGKELKRMGRRNHSGGHRPCHEGGTSAVKRLAPPSANSRVSPSA